LDQDDEFAAAAFEPPSDLHQFAKARMKPVGDTRFFCLFVGSMSPFCYECQRLAIEQPITRRMFTSPKNRQLANQINALD
jgi:hypothetical protein